MGYVDQKFGFLISLTVLLLSACGGAEADGKLPAPLDSEPGQLVRSERCGQCHKDIYSVWSGSIHARAASTPVFLEAYDDAVKRAGDEARQLCLQCHAPSSVVTGNLVLSDSLNQEGINCDFCHSLVGVEEGKVPNPFVLKVEGVKYGPVKDAVSTGHPVSFSDFHSTSELCAGCHEYINPGGVTLLSTYSEWQKYLDGSGNKTCQECHMPLVVASVADPRVSRVRNSFVNLHSMPGGHSLAQLVKSLRLRILEVDRKKDVIHVKVSVENKGAGHMVPTGSPSRKVILSVTATAANGMSARQDYTFQRVVVDTAGDPIEEDSRLFLEGTGVKSDNRLAPDEERIIETTLSLPQGDNVEVRAVLTYLYSPHNRPETETRTEFYSEQKRLVTSWTR